MSQLLSRTTVPRTDSKVALPVAEMMPQRASSPARGSAKFVRYATVTPSYASRRVMEGLSGSITSRHLRPLMTNAMMLAAIDTAIQRKSQLRTPSMKSAHFTPRNAKYSSTKASSSMRVHCSTFFICFRTGIYRMSLLVLVSGKITFGRRALASSGVTMA